jgi:carbon storage regulator CsrA
MLILSRKVNEKVIITIPGVGVVEVYVVGIQHQRKTAVRLGFNAPKEIIIHREEIIERQKDAKAIKQTLPNAHPRGNL